MPNRERYRKYRNTECEGSRRRYWENRDKELARQRKWREENLELKRKIMRESAARRRAEHPEITRAIQRKARENASPEQAEQRRDRIREWHKKHRSEMLEYFRVYNQQTRDREKERARTSNRKAWYRQAIGKFSAGDISDLYEKQNGQCAICGCVFTETGEHRFQIDHIIPLKPRGAVKPVGTNNPDNLQLLCRTCNRSKSNHLPT